MVNLVETKLDSSNQEFPPVSIVVPLRNDVAHVGRCLESLATQSYLKEKLEILVVDGESEDGSAKVVKEFSGNHPNTKILTNPQKITPVARNIGVKQSTGRFIAIIDSHCVIEKDYIREAVAILSSSPDVDCVGGTMKTVGSGYLGQAIALVLSSTFGVGGSKFRTSNRQQFVDTVAFGLYRRAVFEKIGLFDERLVRNQDNDFHARLRQSGGLILLTPEVSSYYYAPDKLYSFCRQAFRNGFWNIRMVRLVGRGLARRHLVPLAFVSGLLLSLLLSSFGRPELFLIIALAYLAGSANASLDAGRKGGWRLAPILPMLFLLLHLSYGFGSLLALFDRAKRPDRSRKRPPEMTVEPERQKESLT